MVLEKKKTTGTRFLTPYILTCEQQKPGPVGFWHEAVVLHAPVPGTLSCVSL